MKPKIFLRQHRAAFFFSPTERKVLQGVLHVSENSGCQTVVVQVLIVFACSSCEKLFFAILHEFLWMLLIVHVVV